MAGVADSFACPPTVSPVPGIVLIFYLKSIHQLLCLSCGQSGAETSTLSRVSRCPFPAFRFRAHKLIKCHSRWQIVDAAPPPLSLLVF